ncbi:hypothetical protein STTU_0959 [Streptomyces sp. Tu6071]|uniref:hypothetical protein n=1 Tax=Streptomyces sp. Tu6071 TaxID=355249 RepID=UPI00020E5285|nr:hypothetical protein [Streptomyces sp. Tu6071]EGJ73748.1 hypothetical protein STTU_0959 [Streptomyces sp. Tu6071]
MDALAAAPAGQQVQEVVDELVPEDLTREQILNWRARAIYNHQVVLDHIARYGEHSAQRLFTRALVATVHRVTGRDHLTLTTSPWGTA